MQEANAREAICDVGLRMWQRRMVSANDGNISVRLDNDLILCTPTGVSKGRLNPQELPIVNLQGEVVQSSTTARPSSEINMHLQVYRDNPEINAVVHAHPIAATLFAIRGQGISNQMLPESVVALPDVPVASYSTPSTAAVGASVSPFTHTHRACLLEQHGALTWDTSLEGAYLNMERLENIAQLELLFEVHSGARDLPQAEILNLKELFGAA